MALINIPDPGAKYTDEEIKALEEKINSIYSEAQTDIQKKLDDHTAKFQKKDAIYRKKLQNKEITQAEYDAWKKGQVFTGKQWAAKKQEIAAVLNNSNKVAAAMINSSAIDVFAENANFLSYSLEHTAGVNFGFGLYNTDAVTKLIKDDPQALPKWKINWKKDYTWNQQNLNRSLTQGIIQGESLDKISKRVSTNLAGSNKNLMKTFAKTGMTQAQNSGRLSQLERAKALGLNVKKEWVATLDARTRTAHQELDGQTVDLDKPFKAEGYTIRYPGDPEAHPSLVYNCRCTLVGDLVDYPSTYERYDNVAGKPIKNMTYKQWKKAKTKTGADIKAKSRFIPVKNKEEAKQALLKLFTSVDDSFLKNNETLIVNNTNQLLELNQRFGALTEDNHGSISGKPYGRAVAWTSSSFAPNANNTTLSLSNKFYSKEAKLLQIEKEGLETFWSMPCADDKISVCTITHEYGHILESFISRRRQDWTAMAEKTQGFNDNLKFKEYNKAEKKHAKAIYEEIIDIAKENNHNFNLHMNLSMYGRASVSEAFAEMFANSQCGKPNELGIAMQKWLEKEGF